MVEGAGNQRVKRLEKGDDYQSWSNCEEDARVRGLTWSAGKAYYKIDTKSGAYTIFFGLKCDYWTMVRVIYYII